MSGIIEGLTGMLTGKRPEPQIVKPTEAVTRKKAGAAQRRQALRKADEGKGATAIGRKTLLGQ